MSIERRVCWAVALTAAAASCSDSTSERASADGGGAGVDAGTGDVGIDAAGAGGAGPDALPDAPSMDSSIDAAGLTTIRVHYDAGAGQSIAIRGDGSGLSWDADAPTSWSPGNVWTYSSSAWTAPVAFKPVHVDDSGSITWPEGTNYVVQPGGSVDVYPFFFRSTGRVETITVSSTSFGSRNVEVYLPPSYDEPGARDHTYPVLFMADGQNLFDPGALFGGWQLGPSLDALLGRGAIDVGGSELVVGNSVELIVVAPHNGGAQRIYEYTPTNASVGGCDATVEQCGGGAEQTLDFFADEVLPQVRASYRTRGTHVGLGGSSLGGLLSFHACWTRPMSFDRCAAMSPSLWWDGEWILGVVAADMEPKRAISLYLDAGTENDGQSRVEQLHATLRDMPSGQSYVAGQDVWCQIGQGDAHDEIAWRRRAPWAIHSLYADPDREHPAVAPPADLTPCP